MASCIPGCWYALRLHVTKTHLFRNAGQAVQNLFSQRALSYCGCEHSQTVLRNTRCSKTAVLTTKLLLDSLAGVVDSILVRSEIARARENRFAPTSNFLLL